jgi:glycosyltransferase involved in cell wall biosynthesis
VRVGLDGTPLLGARTGVGWYTAELLEAMARLSPGDEFVVFPVSWRTARDVQVPPLSNIEVVNRLAPARPLRAMWDRVAFPPLEAFVRADVFHATNFLAPPSWRMPVVATVHDIGFVRFPDLTGPRERELIDLLPKSLRRSAAVIVVSDFTRRELLDWLPELADRVHVVPNAAHARALPAVPRPARPFMLVLGSLNPRKNIGLALDAVARMPDLDVVLAGAPAPGFDVAAMISERGLGGRVDVRGYVDDEAMGVLLASASVLGFPSRYEGFGMPLLEAMHARVPIVATDAGATPEIAGDAALLVPDDPDAFAGAVSAAAFDPAVRERLVTAGTQRVEAFSWQASAARTREVYASVVR